MMNLDGNRTGNRRSSKPIPGQDGENCEEWSAQQRPGRGTVPKTRTDAVAVMREMGPMPAGNEPNVKLSGAVTDYDQ